jgi:hypothetical protein
MLSCVVAIIQNSAQSQQSVSFITREAGHDPSPSLASSARSQILIANPRLESKLSRKDPNHLQIPNRERMGFSSFPASREPLISNLQNLIVTPRLESPATPTKQNSKPISNRYKTRLSRSAAAEHRSSLRFSAHHSSPITHPLACPEEAEGRRRASVAPTSRKAIMSRNHINQILRSKPLERKVTNADPNQS